LIGVGAIAADERRLAGPGARAVAAIGAVDDANELVEI
jgi:hypothetical protein